MNTKWLSLGAMTGFFLLVFLLGRHVVTPKNAQTPLEAESFINYVVPKLKTFIPKFSLWDRKFIDRRKLAPKSAETNTVPTKPAAVATKPTPTPTAKPVAAVATPTPTPAPEASSQQITVTKNDNNEDFDPAQANPYGGGSNNLAPIPSDVPSPETQIGEWKMRIMRSPTKETINEFVFEFQTGKVERAVFYQVIGELMSDSNSELQRLGIYALVSTPSYDSLYTLLNNKEHLSSEAQTTLRLALDTYAKSDKMDLIKMTLRSDTHPVVLGSMSIAIKMSKHLKLWSADQSSTLDDRDRRGPHTRVPKKGFMEIVEILKQLEESNDRQIAQAAHDTLNQLSVEPSFASSRN